MKAVRGATTIVTDDTASILSATRELLEAMLDRNGLTAAQIVSALFTCTSDIRSEFPARAARELGPGWETIPLLCVAEMDVAGALPLCIRVLLHVESPVPRAEIRHVYLRGAGALRPDLPAD